KVEVSRADANGKLQLLAAGIGRGEALVYHPDTRQTEVIRKDAELMSAWRSGNSLYMDEMTLEQIGGELSRHFYIRVTVTQP
ncbi:hypothetical protein ABTO49_21830, partial [Acinetobacter baumannii]